MEWQANSLAPRIQMPIDQFKTKATAFIQKYRREFSDVPLVNIMEPVIEELATFFCVSRQAAKIRMVDAGYQEAIGAFTYIDGHYVRPHAFKKGSVEKCQTYSIGVDDAAFVALSDMRLRDQAGKGVYVYVDSHFCLNDPKYIINDETGRVVMTEYARLHIDECCLAFDLKVKSKNKYGEQYYKECVLYRDVNSGIEFQVAFSGDANKDIMAKADAILGREVHTQNIINSMEITISFGGSSGKADRTGKGKSLLALPTTYTVVDLETTGLDPQWNDIIEFGAMRVENGIVLDRYTALVNPGYEIDDFITELTGITNEMLASSPAVADVLPEFLNFVGESVVVGHNVNFDINFIYDTCISVFNKSFSNDFIDTMLSNRRRGGTPPMCSKIRCIPVSRHSWF